MKILLITIAIGDRYFEIYNKLFRKSQEAYAIKNGYDFKIIRQVYVANGVANGIANVLLDTVLDTKSLPSVHPDLISFQKILVCSQEFSLQYDYIIFIDADILININAPPLHSIVDFTDKIGIVDEYSQPTKELRIQLQRRNRWEDNATDYYKLAGLALSTDKVFNSGLLVMQPAKHSQFLLDIYNKYFKNAIGHSRGFHYEQSCIGFELQKENKYIILDNKWNALWAIYRNTGIESNLQKMYDNNYIIHFAGHSDYNLVPNIIMNNK